jgi:DNA-binding GntR family transcriptional regulator
VIIAGEAVYAVYVPDLDPYSPLPRSQQLAAILRGRIESGELKAGDTLPSQTTLMQDYGVARATASKATRILIDAGLVVVVPGMGTYVKPQ